MEENPTRTERLREWRDFQRKAWRLQDEFLQKVFDSLILLLSIAAPLSLAGDLSQCRKIILSASLLSGLLALILGGVRLRSAARIDLRISYQWGKELRNFLPATPKGEDMTKVEKVCGVSFVVLGVVSLLLLITAVAVN